MIMSTAEFAFVQPPDFPHARDSQNRMYATILTPVSPRPSNPPVAPWPRIWAVLESYRPAQQKKKDFLAELRKFRPSIHKSFMSRVGKHHPDLDTITAWLYAVNRPSLAEFFAEVEGQSHEVDDLTKNSQGQKHSDIEIAHAVTDSAASLNPSAEASNAERVAVSLDALSTFVDAFEQFAGGVAIEADRLVEARDALITRHARHQTSSRRSKSTGTRKKSAASR